jgi:hypothetical protein
MSLDRFVNWKKERPTKRQVRAVLRDFFSTYHSIKWDRDRFYIKLPGKPSCAYRSLARTRKIPLSELPQGRCIEVHLGKGNLDVITRHADEYTNALAQGLAEAFSRFWDGDLEVG